MIQMKRVAGVVLVGAGTLIALVTFGGVALAGPDSSPSARAAARLKHRPQGGWINHYLPDDRYKIKGGVWRFVSTEMDDRYYLPDSPHMLSQPPGIVIGFASEADAQEAGYRPGPDVERRAAQSAARSAARYAAHYAAQARRLPRRRQAAVVASPGFPAASAAPTIVSIPASRIPRHILAFIRLVDGVAADIEGASSPGELLRISLETRITASSFERSVVPAYLGATRATADEMATMMGIMRQLAGAADTKREPGPLGFGLTMYRHHTNAARSEVRNLIPQVRELRIRRMRDAANRMQQEQQAMVRGTR